MNRWMGAIALGLALGACGGGGGGGGGSGTVPMGQSSSASQVDAAAQAKLAKAEEPTPGATAAPADQGGPIDVLRAQGPDGVAAVKERMLARPPTSPTYSYKLGTADFSDPVAFLAELNSAEMTGYLFDGITHSRPTGNKAIYQRRSNAVGYVHRLLPQSEAQSLSGFHAQGAEGYLVEGARIDAGANGAPFFVNTILKKAVGQTTTYEYQEVEGSMQPGETAASSLAAFNKLGQQGFCKAELTVTPWVGFILGREVPSTARCTFLYRPSATTYRDFVVMANEEGAKGGRYAMHTLLDNKDLSLFVRDETRSTVFSHYIVEMPPAEASIEDWLAFLNREGAAGGKPLEYFTEGSRKYMIFMRTYNCQGMLC